MASIFGGSSQAICSVQRKLLMSAVLLALQDYSFKLMRKNQYEEALFRCEDDR